MLTREEELRFCKARRAAIELDFQNLNPEQRRAVLATEGPLLLLAGAGSGKTTVLIHRIANLMKYGRGSDSDEVPDWVTEDDLAFLEGYAASRERPAPEDKEQERLCRLDPAVPWSIIAITFTNKAAGELKERLERMLGPEANDIWASTFHSACVRILRRDIERLGFRSGFTIYDTADSERVVKDILKDFGLDDKTFPPKSVLGYISRAKDAMKLGADYLRECEKSGDFRLVKIAKIYVEYERRLREANALDFDDIILHTVRLLQQFDDVREYYQKKFRYVLIDEYQDTNHLQYQLASALAGGYENICVVGDDDQSIYRFRGATIENILSFEQQYKGARVIRLEQNYRSTKNILEASNAVIRNNQGRKGKELWTEQDAGDKVMCYTAMNEHDEAQYVAAQILTGFSGGRAWKDHAVLYRMNAQSNQLEQAFKRNGIPYRIIGGIRFFDRAEVKDMLAYLCVVNNPNDDLRLGRIINNPPRGIGATTVERAQAIAAAGGALPVAGGQPPRGLSRTAEGGGQAGPVCRADRGAAAALRRAPAARFLRRTGGAYRLRGDAGAEEYDRGPHPPGERPGAAHLHQQLPGERRGALPGGLFGRDRPVHRPGQPRPQRGLRGDDDHALGQGAGVPGGVRGGHGGGHLPRHPGHRRAGGDGGGAPAVLCGHDPGQGEAVHDLRQPAHALRPHQRQPALPLFGGDPAGIPGALRPEPLRRAQGRGAGRRTDPRAGAARLPAARPRPADL